MLAFGMGVVKAFERIWLAFLLFVLVLLRSVGGATVSISRFDTGIELQRESGMCDAEVAGYLVSQL